MWRVLLLLGCFVLAFTDSVLAHILPSNESALRACEFRFGQPPPTLPEDVDLLSGFYDQTFIIPLLHPPTNAQPITCSNFGWAHLHAIPHAEVTIEVGWAGRELTRTRTGDAQFWDCNHSSIEYGIFATTSVFFPASLNSFGGFEFQELLLEQRLIGGGKLFGWLTPREARTKDSSVQGECVYRTTDPIRQYNFPAGWGRDSQETTAVGGLRIALLSWSHNDATIGHAGTDCADVSCWWPTQVRIAISPIGGTSTPCGVAFDDQVVIYQHSQFGGKCKVLDVGEYAHSDAFAPVGNDSVSSVQVGASVSVTLYQHANFEGLHQKLLSGQYPSLGRFNDRTSSMKVQLR